MNTYFKIVLENECADAAKKFLYAVSYVNGEHAVTERGKQKDAEKWEPIREQRKERLLELLNINYPEFRSRFRNVSYFRTKDDVCLSVDRNIPDNSTNVDPWTP